MDPRDRDDNRRVLAYLAGGRDLDHVGVERPGQDVDTWRLGAHPDIVELLWTRFNAALPADCRFLVADTAALVDPDSGAVLAVALGTQYAIRLTGDVRHAARAAGFETRHTFATVGRTLDLVAEFGEGWFFGRRDSREAEWLAASRAGIGS